MTIDISFLKHLGIVAMFAVLFGTAGFDKFKVLQTPDWFIKQFENTLIAKLPGGAKLGYWVIATLELALFFTFVASVFVSGLLAYALVGSIFLFAALCFGLRLASDFQGSANMFVYFAATLVALLSL